MIKGIVLGIIIGVSAVYLGILITGIIVCNKRLAEFEKEETEK